MKTKVWTISIRLFHWLLAIGFAAAYLLSDFHDAMNLHYAFGLMVGTLIVFRIMYGFMGSKYARFADFPVSLENLRTFVRHFNKKDKTYTGHNPAAALVMISIFVVGLACSISGYLLYSVKNPSLIQVSISKGLIKETHEILGNLFLMLVILHLLGIISDLLFHPNTKTWQSIFTGYKNVDAENSKQSSFQTIFSVVWFIVPLFMFAYGSTLKTVPRGNKHKIEQEEHQKHNEGHEQEKE